MSSSKNSKSKYAQDRREEDRLKRVQHTQNEVLKIMSNFLSNFSAEHINTSIYPDVYTFIDSKATSLAWKKAGYAFFRNYIKDLNSSREEPLDLPDVVFDMKRDTPVISFNWLEHGAKVNQINRHLLDYWTSTSKADTFSAEEVIGNILISSILYGGISQQATLEAFFEHLIKPQSVQDIAGFTVIFLTPISEKYGDVFNNDNALAKSRQFIPDHITRLWLFHYYHRKIRQPTRDLSYYLTVIFKKMNLEFTRKQYKSLLSYAHYHWSQLENINISPALIHCLTEKIPTCGLSEIEFQRYFQPQFRNKITLEDHSGATDKTSKAYQMLVPSHLQNSISCVKKIHKDVLKIISLSKTDRPIVELLIDYCLDQHANFNEYTQRLALWLISLYRPTLQQLSTLAEQFNCSAQQIYNSFRNYGPLKDSSIYSYYTRIGEPWLIHSLEYIDQDEDLNICLELIYQQMISHRQATELNDNSEDLGSGNKQTDEKSSSLSSDKIKSNKHAPFIKMLARFHRFQEEVFQADSFDFGPIHQYTKPRARLIGKQTYKLLIQKLKVMSQLEPAEEHHYLSLRLIYTLAYRTGMRINEILGLRLKDIEGLKDFSIWIQPYGSKKLGNLQQLKTDSARRILPVYCLLNDEEKNLFHDYIVQQRLSVKPSSYLFHLWNSSARLPTHSVTKPFKLIMDELFEEHDYSFHAFRHSAANNFALVLNVEDLKVVQKFVDFSEENIVYMRQQLLRTFTGQDKWFLIAHLLGHIDPTETFRSYLHLTYFMGGMALFKYQPDFPTYMVRHLMGLAHSCEKKPSRADQRKFNFNRHLDVTHQMISANHPSWLKSNVQDIAKSLRYEVTKPHDYFKYFAGTPESKITFSLFFEALKLLEQLHDPKNVAQQLNLPFNLVEFWYANAIALSTLRSRNDKLRLFKQQKTHLCLRPRHLKTAEDKKVLTYFFKNLQVIFEHSPDGIEYVLNSFLNRTSFVKAGIQYPWSKIEELEKFYQCITVLFPTELWLVSGKNVLEQLHSTRSQTPLLYQLANKRQEIQINKLQDYARLQLYSSQYKKSLTALDFCLHLACIGRPKEMQLNFQS